MRFYLSEKLTEHAKKMNVVADETEPLKVTTTTAPKSPKQDLSPKSVVDILDNVDVAAPVRS